MTKAERSWILYDCANSAHTLIVTTAVLPIYFKEVAAAGMADPISTAWWGFGNTLAAIIVALMAPVLGAVADHRGKKKRFFTFFLVVGVIATAALFLVDKGEWQRCLSLFIVSTVGFYGAIVFYDSFLVDVAEKDRMDWVSASGFGWGYVTSTVPFIAFILVGKFYLTDNPILAARLAFLLTAIWWIGLSIPMLRNVHQVNFVPDTPNPIRESFQRLGHTLRDIARYKYLFMFLIAYFLYIDGVHTIYKMATAFGTDVGIDRDTLLFVLLVTQVVAFPFALLYGRLAKVFTAKRMILFGILTYFVVVTLAYFVQSAWHFWVLGILIGTAQGGVQALSRSFYGKLVPKEKFAQFFGFYDIFGKFAAILGPSMVAGFGLYFENARAGVFSLILLFIAGGAILLFVPDEPEAATS